MSTRAQVILSNNEDLIKPKTIWRSERLRWLIDKSCILYHHRDGNPEDMLPWIFEILNLPHNRLTDIEYLNAIMLWYWKHTENDLTQKIQDWHTDFSNEENYRQLWLSHWVSNRIHWDTQYLYIVYVPSKTVHVLEYDYDKDYWYISQTHNYNPFTS